MPGVSQAPQRLSRYGPAVAARDREVRRLRPNRGTLVAAAAIPARRNRRADTDSPVATFFGQMEVDARKGADVIERPNKRVQRTRVARCARPGSPLTRHPLGDAKIMNRRSQ